MRQGWRALLGFVQDELGSDDTFVVHPPCEPNAVRILAAAHETPAMFGKSSFHEFILPSTGNIPLVEGFACEAEDQAPRTIPRARDVCATPTFSCVGECKQNLPAAE